MQRYSSKVTLEGWVLFHQWTFLPRTAYLSNSLGNSCCPWQHSCFFLNDCPDTEQFQIERFLLFSLLSFTWGDNWAGIEFGSFCSDINYGSFYLHRHLLLYSCGSTEGRSTAGPQPWTSTTPKSWPVSRTWSWLPCNTGSRLQHLGSEA